MPETHEPRCEKTGLRDFRPGPTLIGLYSHYLCSENKGADQLRSYREADLRLCFRICKKPVFSQRGSHVISAHRLKIETGRYIKLERSERLCNKCSAGAVEDEQHFLI